MIADLRTLLPNGHAATLIWRGTIDSIVETEPGKRTSALTKDLRTPPPMACPLLAKLGGGQ